jgi:ribosome biogenesis GTPase / thiamine phosphate phosphatase
MSRDERKLRKHLEAHASRDLKKELQRQRKLEKASRWKGKTQVRRQSRPESVPGIVVETGSGFCDAECAGERIRCRVIADVAIGDRVLVARERRTIESVLPRRTSLSRPDPHNPQIERVIAANVDVVVNVVSLRNPPLRAGLIDRYLIAIEKSGAEPLICVNKIDLLDSDSELNSLHAYSRMRVPVLLCSAATGAGLEDLAAALRDKICVFSGHSGVGKSSLLNALDPQFGLATAAVSEATHTGRHTTTSSSLHRLSNGAAIIDTPGIREFGLWNVRAEDVRRYFRDLAEYASGCAFSDCTHSHEPHCGVKQAMEEGRLPSERYAAYLRIMESLR